MANLFSALAKATANAVKTTFNEFDFDKEMKEMQKSMSMTSKYLYSEAKKLTSHIHNYFDKFVVEVNFDQSTDTIKSQIKNNSLIVIVNKESNNSESTLTTTIPENVIVSSLVQKYDAKNKKALFIFNKKDAVTEKKEG